MTVQKRPNLGRKKGSKKPIPKQERYPDPEPNIKKPKDELWVDPTPTRELQASHQFSNKGLYMYFQGSTKTYKGHETNGLTHIGTVENFHIQIHQQLF